MADRLARRRDGRDFLHRRLADLHRDTTRNRCRRKSPPGLRSTRFRPLTISDQQFPDRRANGKQVTVAGEFRIAQGSGKLPVVVIDARLERRRRLHRGRGRIKFNAMGISTFVIDGFSGRGLDRGGPETRPARPAQPDRRYLSRAGDSRQASTRGSGAHRADGIFARRTGPRWYAQPQIASTSSGTSPACSLTAIFPFYPDCSTTYAADTEVARAPDPDLSRHAGRL